MNNCNQKKAIYSNNVQTRQKTEEYINHKKELQDISVEQLSDQTEILRQMGDDNIVILGDFIAQRGIPARFFNYDKMKKDYPDLYKEYYGVTNKEFIRIVNLSNGMKNYFDKL